MDTWLPGRAQSPSSKLCSMNTREKPTNLETMHLSLYLNNATVSPSEMVSVHVSALNLPTWRSFSISICWRTQPHGIKHHPCASDFSVHVTSSAFL